MPTKTIRNYNKKMVLIKELLATEPVRPWMMMLGGRVYYIGYTWVIVAVKPGWLQLGHVDHGFMDIRMREAEVVLDCLGEISESTKEAYLKTFNCQLLAVTYDTPSIIVTKKRMSLYTGTIFDEKCVATPAEIFFFALQGYECGQFDYFLKVNKEQVAPVETESTLAGREVAERVSGAVNIRVPNYFKPTGETEVSPEELGLTKCECGGWHGEGVGYNPQGVFCGECTLSTCCSCRFSAVTKEEAKQHV